MPADDVLEAPEVEDEQLWDEGSSIFASILVVGIVLFEDEKDDVEDDVRSCLLFLFVEAFLDADDDPID